MIRTVRIDNEFTLENIDVSKLLLGKESFVMCGFDPGLITGFAAFEVDPVGELTLLKTHEYDWDHRIMMTNELLIRYSPKIVVVKTYRSFSEQTATQIESTIGAAEVKGIIMMAYYHTFAYYGTGHSPIIVFQNPGEESGRIRFQDAEALFRVSDRRKEAYKHCRLLYERMCVMAERIVKSQ